MDDPQTMSVLDGAGQNRDHLRRRSECPGRVVEPVGEVASLDILHLEVKPAVVVAKSVDLNDIGVPNLGDGLGLSQEADEVLGASMFALEDHFQSAKAIEPELARLVNDGHAAAAQLGQDLIARDLQRWVHGDLRAIARSPDGHETVAHLILGGTERIRDPEEAILVRPRIAGQQPIDLSLQLRVAGTCLPEQEVTLGGAHRRAAVKRAQTCRQRSGVTRPLPRVGCGARPGRLASNPRPSPPRRRAPRQPRRWTARRRTAGQRPGPDARPE